MRKHRHSVTEEPVKIAGIATLAAAVGAFVALLVTPRSGRQVRSGLKRRSSNLKHSMQDRISDGVEEAGDTADDAKERLQSTANQAAKSTKTKAATAKSKATSTARGSSKTSTKK